MKFLELYTFQTKLHVVWFVSLVFKLSNCLNWDKYSLLLHVWIDGNFGRITESHCNLTEASTKSRYCHDFVSLCFVCRMFEAFLIAILRSKLVSVAHFPLRFSLSIQTQHLILLTQPFTVLVCLFPFHQNFKKELFKLKLSKSIIKVKVNQFLVNFLYVHFHW